tara:strand:- start:1432 stop:1761 length:330 start_codon:yes stop_codon:yes gene_type:complete
MSDKKIVVEKATPKEILTGFYNGHLKEFLAASVRLRVAETSDPHETVGQRQVPPLGPNQQPAVVDIKAKEMIPHEKKIYNMQAKFLLSVEEGFKEIEKDPTPWRTNTQK